jgi:hypothetical protein
MKSEANLCFLTAPYNHKRSQIGLLNYNNLTNQFDFSNYDNRECFVIWLRRSLKHSQSYKTYVHIYIQAYESMNVMWIWK